MVANFATVVLAVATADRPAESQRDRLHRLRPTSAPVGSSAQLYGGSVSRQTERVPSRKSTALRPSVGSAVAAAPIVAPASGTVAGTPVSATVGSAGAAGPASGPGRTGVGSGGTGVGSGGMQLRASTTVIVSVSLAVWPAESSATAVSVRAAHGASAGIANVAVAAGGIAVPTWRRAVVERDLGDAEVVARGRGQRDGVAAVVRRGVGRRA